MRNLTTTLLAACAALGVGCVPAPADDLDSASLALLDGTPEGIGVLDLLNDPTTTLEVLDDDVPLDVRAGSNLVEARAADGPFETIAQVDAVPWVGPSALDRLVDYADAKGWVPAGDDLLGTWDGVAFTVAEADATLALVNGSDHATLDDDLGLDRRAADSIVAAQPVPSVAHLASLYFVGGGALTSLRDAAASPASPSEPYEDQFNHDEAVSIPDAWGDGVDTDVHVLGVPDVPVEVVVVVDLDHEALWELAITLTNPDGDTVAIGVTGPTIVEPVWVSGSPNGTWTLNVADPVPGFDGDLLGWAIEVTSID